MLTEDEKQETLVYTYDLYYQQIRNQHINMVRELARVFQESTKDIEDRIKALKLERAKQ